SAWIAMQARTRPIRTGMEIRITNSGAINNVDFTLTMQTLSGETMNNPDSFNQGISGINYTGTLAVENDEYFFEFTSRPGLVVYFTLTGEAGTDFDLYILSKGGTVLLPSGSPPTSYPEKLNVIFSEENTYFIQIQAYTGSGAFTLFVDVKPGETVEKAVEISSEGVYQGSLDATEDLYYFKIITGGTASQSVTFSLTGETGTNFDLFLYDSSLNRLTSSENETYPEAITYSLAAGGQYYIEVYSYDGAGEFSLTVSGLVFVSTSPSSGEGSSYTTGDTLGFTIGIIFSVISLAFVVLRKRKIS
ncbi:MAG: PPC domain-containing protein, partial [Candidatus Hodarchaeota archaeon]